jgi:hypothetical protein
MIKKFLKYIFNYNKNKTKLGRWNLKSCSNTKTIINSIYQNRDHCGDILCKEAIKADKFIK